MSLCFVFLTLYLDSVVSQFYTLCNLIHGLAFRFLAHVTVGISFAPVK